MEVLTAVVCLGLFVMFVLSWVATGDSRVRLQVLFFPPNMTPLNEPILRDGKTCAQILAEQELRDGHTIVKIAFVSGARWLTHGRLDVMAGETSRINSNCWHLSREYDIGPEHNEAIERLGEKIAELYSTRIRARKMYSLLGFSRKSLDLVVLAGEYRWN